MKRKLGRNCFSCRDLAIVETCAHYEGEQCPRWRPEPITKQLKRRWQKRLSRHRNLTPQQRLQRRLDAIFCALCVLIAVLLFR